MNKIQKQYERKLKVNQNNDVFTTFQRHSLRTHSPLIPKTRQNSNANQTQHEQIQSMKSTLKSLVPVSMELTKQYSRKRGDSLTNSKEQKTRNDEYMNKLDNLTKNLEQIASKCYFSPGNTQSFVEERTFKNHSIKSQFNFEKSQTISRYEQPQKLYQYTNNVSLELPPNRNQSFYDKNFSRSQSKSKNKHDASLKEIKYNRQEKKDRSSSKSKNKAYSKKDVVNELLSNPSTSKNLVKIFETYDNSSCQSLLKDKHESKLKKYVTVFNEKVHRHRITSILVSDQIYTSSLDYTIKRVQQDQRDNFSCSLVQKYKGGVQHLSMIGTTLYSCSRDSYIRSVDSSYYYRCPSLPLYFSQNDRANLINISFKDNQLRLFDLQKRKMLSSLQIDVPFEAMNKFNKELYIGTRSALFGVDWRQQGFLVNLYKDAAKTQCRWLSDPFSRAFWFQNNGQLTILNPDFRKIRQKMLPLDCEVTAYSWNRMGLFLMLKNQVSQRLVRQFENKESEEVDVPTQINGICKVVVRQKQVIYGSIEGDLVIKHIRK